MRTKTWMLLLAGLCLAGPVRAGEIDDASFGLRMTAAISRFSRYPDVGGIGGASAGSQWGSSVNPASAGWNPPVGDMGWGTSAQYWRFDFDNGTDVDLGAASAAYDAGEWGVWQPAVLILESDVATMDDGLDFEWKAFSLDLQWALKALDNVAVGFDLSYLSAEIDFSLDSIDVAESRSSTYGIRGGVLWEQSENLFLGAAVDYAFAPSRTTEFDFTGAVGGDSHESDTAHQLIIRPGVYTFLTEELTIYADYQFGYFSDDTGRLRVHRLAVGLDQTIVEGLYGRGGAVVDVEGNFSFTLGLGIAPSESLLIDLAYQHDMFPEIEEEFGGTDIFSIGISTPF